MARFILITFGFMGWAFYEMSGGADFDAEALRLARIDAPVSTSVPVDTGTTLLAEVDTRNPSDADVTRVALNLTTTRDVAAPTRTLDTKPARLVDAAVQPPVATRTTTTFAGATLSTASLNVDPIANPSIILPSLITGPTTPAALIVPGSEPQDTALQDDGIDIRSVTGNRVNVRGGPSTDFAIVDQLTRGAEVEVLQDTGDGWVQFRPLDGGTVGWMADFLLTSG